MPTGNALDVVTLVSWLATEALGAFMVRSWLARGGARAAMSVPVLVGHAGLNLAGLVCWIVFVIAAAKPAAWLALALLAPAIGLGVSTVTIWTPYPGDTPEAEAPSSGVVPDSAIKRALDDEELASQLVDELLARNLAQPVERAERKSGWYLRPLVPASHGVLAIATFALAVISAVSAG